MLLLGVGALVLAAQPADASSRKDADLQYLGPTSGEQATPVTVRAQLSPKLVGEAIVFRLNNTETCSGKVRASGIVSCSITPREAPGTYVLTARFSGNSKYTDAFAAAPFTVTPAALVPTTLVYTGPTTSVTGTPVTLSALLSPAVIGAPIVFTLNSAETCTGTVNLGGFATCSITPHESPGTYSLVASFAGNSAYGPASTTVPFTVTAAPRIPTTLVYTGPTTGVTGHPVTLSALLSPAVIGAPIVFTLNGAETCTGTVGLGGFVSCSLTPAEPPGAYSLIASFAGNAAYGPSSTTVTFTVTAAPRIPTTLTYTGPTTSITGHPVTLSALLSPAVVGAPIVFTLNSAETCTGTVGLGGFASCSITPAEPAGTYSLVASFAGNAAYAPSSATVPFIVTAAPQIPTTLAYTGPTTAITGTTVSLTALLTPAVVGASIVFTLNSAETCTGTVSVGGFAGCSITPAEAPGTYSLTASFAGTATYAPSSTTVPFVVTAVPQTPTTLVYTGPTTSVTGAPVAVSAVLTPALLGAPVVFTLNSAETCTGLVNLGGFASCSITPAEPAGTYALTASFAGTAAYAPSSTTVTFTITAAPQIPTTLVYNGPTTGVSGAPVTLSAMLTPALIGAPIVFTLNSAETCTSTVGLGGFASCSLTPAEAPGAYSLSASFAGTPTYAPSSTTVTFTVTAAPQLPTTLVYTGPVTGTTGTPVTLSAELSPALIGAPIVFTLNGAETCTGTVGSGGFASCSITPAEAAGTYPVSASFAGTPTYAPSSATVTFTITAAPPIPTTLVYVGPTTGVTGVPITLSAMLSPAILGAPIVFTLNSAETCTSTVGLGGFASCDITPAEAAGTYPLTASFAGDATHDPSSTTVTFTVTTASQIPTTLVYTGPTTGVTGFPVTASAVLAPALVGAPIVFTLNGVETCTGTVGLGGFASCDLTPAETPGDYPLIASFAGTSTYAPSSTTVTFTVTDEPSIPTTLTYTGPTSGDTGDPVAVSAVLSPVLVGAPIVFTLNGAETCTSTVGLGGFASCEITPAEAAGTYPLIASFAGTAIYAPSSATITFTVTEAAPIPTTLVYTGPASGATGLPVTVSALLTPDLIGAPIVFTLNSAETCTGAVGLGGFASCEITPAEAPGTYSLIASFAGNATYAPSSVTASFAVTAAPQLPTTLVYTGETTGVTGNPATVSALLTPALLGAPIVFTLNSAETCTGTVDLLGIASCSITPAEAAGTYPLTASFAGTAVYAPSSTTVTFTVTSGQIPTTLVYTGSTTGVTGSPVAVSALLTPALAGAPIVFTLNSAETCTGTISVLGTASCSITPAEAAGIYPLTASFAGTAAYAPSSDSVMFTVTTATQTPTTLVYTGPTTGVSGSPVAVSALLTPALVGAPIVFTLNSAETCTGTVDVLGAASCSITPAEAAGTYALTASFVGTPIYAPSSATTPFTVTAAPPIPTALVYTGPVTGPTGTAVTVSAVLAPALVGAPIVFTLNSAETCTGTVGAGGSASCSLTPAETPGIYSLTASFAGTPTYASSSATTPFTVTSAPLIPTVLVYVGATTGATGSPVTASAMLTPAVIGLPIVFTLNSAETCTGTVGLGGFATCVITPAEAPGSYSLLASFAGNATFAPSSDTVAFTVTAPIATALAYTGDTFLGNGTVARLAGVLTQMGSLPLAGRTVSFTLGTGASAQTCTGITDATGTAACLIDAVQAPLNAAATIPIAASYAGEPGVPAAATTTAASLEYMTAEGVAAVASIELHTGSADLGPLPDLTPVRSTSAPLDHACTTEPITASIGSEPVLSVANACGSVATRAAPGTSIGTASAGSTTLDLAGVVGVIQLGALRSSSQSSCTGSTGSSSVASLSIGGVTVPVPSGVNATLPLPGGQITFNEQLPVAGADEGLTVTAVHIVIDAPGVATVDIALGQSESAIHNCRVGPPSPPEADRTPEADEVAPADELDEVGGCQSTRPDHAAWLIALVLVAGRRWRRRRAPHA